MRQIRTEHVALFVPETRILPTKYLFANSDKRLSISKKNPPLRHNLND